MSLSTADDSLELASDKGRTLPINRSITLHIRRQDSEAPDSEAPDSETPENKAAKSTVKADSTKTRSIDTFEAIAQQVTLVAAPPTSNLNARFQDCHLLLSISLEQYQRVLDQSLFHLKPEIRGPLHQTSFQPDSPILLELGLDANQSPSLRPELSQLEAQLEANTPLEEIACLPKHTDSWRCRAVRQEQADGETVGYTTLWAYTTPAEVEPLIESGSEAIASIASLFEKTMTVLKAEIEQDLPQVKQHLSKVSDQLAAALEHVDWDAALLDDLEDQETDEAAKPLISDVAKQFFDTDDWAYVQLTEATDDDRSEAFSDTTVLQLAFQGDSGRWTCLAYCEDRASQIIFYSLCPISVPDGLYAEISELLMRANDSLIIGNFELNFETGNIRYKTSLDVEGDRLTPALVRSLVYPNVQTLDTYLPSILAVLDKRSTPVEALEKIESKIAGENN